MQKIKQVNAFWKLLSKIRQFRSPNIDRLSETGLKVDVVKQLC